MSRGKNPSTKEKKRAASESLASKFKFWENLRSPLKSYIKPVAAPPLVEDEHPPKRAETQHVDASYRVKPAINPPDATASAHSIEGKVIHREHLQFKNEDEIDQTGDWDSRIARIIPANRIQDCIRTGCVAPADIFVDFPTKSKSKVVVDFRSNQSMGLALDTVFNTADDDFDDESVVDTDAGSVLEAPIPPPSLPAQLPHEPPATRTNVRRPNRASSTHASYTAPPIQSRTSSTSSYKTAKSNTSSSAPHNSADDDESFEEDSPAVSDNDSDYTPSSGSRPSRVRKRSRDEDQSDEECGDEPTGEVDSDEEALETTSKAPRNAKRQKKEDGGLRVREFLFPRPSHSFICLEPNCGHQFKVTCEDGEPTIPNADLTSHYLKHFVPCKVWDEKQKKMVDKLRCGLTMMQAAEVKQTHDKAGGHKAVITLFSFKSPCDAHYKDNAAANKSIYRHVQGKHLLTHVRECQQCFTVFTQSRSDSAFRHAKDNCDEHAQGGVSPEYEVVDVGVVAAPTKQAKGGKPKTAVTSKGGRKTNVATRRAGSKTMGERRKSERKKTSRA